MEELKNENQQVVAVHNVSNCPDLTDQWNLITEKWQNGELTDLEKIVLHRALDILERKDIIVMKHGI